MKYQQRRAVKAAVEKLISAVAGFESTEDGKEDLIDRIAGDFEPKGFGTDGGCWTDEDVVEFLRLVTRRSIAVLKKLPA